MGLFFNYDKPGPGVDKNAPRHWGIFLYFELLWRNFGKMILSNLLYFAVSLPVLALYFVFVTYILGVAMPDSAGTTAMAQASVIITLVLVILWGTGPTSCGYTYLLRNTAREEHTWVFSDFFEKCRESFLHGLVFLIVDILVLLCTSVAIWTYWGLAQSSGGIFTALLFITLIVFVIYTAMHFYIYEFEVTFQSSILQVYKNALIMAMATLPMCILIGAIIYVISTYLLGFLTPIGIILVALLCWVSFMRFIVDFYSARVIKKRILPKFEEPGEDDE